MSIVKNYKDFVNENWQEDYEKNKKAMSFWNRIRGSQRAERGEHVGKFEFMNMFNPSFKDFKEHAPFRYNGRWLYPVAAKWHDEDDIRTLDKHISRDFEDVYTEAFEYDKRKFYDALRYAGYEECSVFAYYDPADGDLTCLIPDNTGFVEFFIWEVGDVTSSQWREIKRKIMSAFCKVSPDICHDPQRKDM